MMPRGRGTSAPSLKLTVLRKEDSLASSWNMSEYPTFELGKSRFDQVSFFVLFFFLVKLKFDTLLWTTVGHYTASDLFLNKIFI